MTNAATTTIKDTMHWLNGERAAQLDRIEHLRVEHQRAEARVLEIDQQLAQLDEAAAILAKAGVDGGDLDEATAGAVALADGGEGVAE